MNLNLPIYEITFDPEMFESGIDLIAMTENPAIETHSMRFNKEDISKLFFADGEKRIVAGPAIIPDKPIYRKKGDKEFYVVFTKETIEQMVEKFNSENRDYKFNIEHDSEQLVAGFIKGSWIIEDKDKSSFYGFTDLPVGTWFIEAKISDESVWNTVIKQMDKVGFSIEGLMGAVGIEFSSDNNIKNKQKNMKDIKKFNSTFNTIKSVFNEETKKFESVSTDNDVMLEVESLEEGKEVMVEVDGEMTPASDGNYFIPESNTNITVKDGVIVSMEVEEEKGEEIEEEAPEEEEMVDEAVEEVAEEVTEEEITEEDSAEVEAMMELIQKLVELEARLETLESANSNKEKTGQKEVFRKTETIADRLQYLKSIL